MYWVHILRRLLHIKNPDSGRDNIAGTPCIWGNTVDNNNLSKLIKNSWNTITNLKKHDQCKFFMELALMQHLSFSEIVSDATSYTFISLFLLQKMSLLERSLKLKWFLRTDSLNNLTCICFFFRNCCTFFVPSKNSIRIWVFFYFKHHIVVGQLPKKRCKIL